jgi:SPOR domain
MSYQFEPAQVERRRELLGDRRETEEPPPQRILSVAAALVVMAVFAAGLWFAYYEGTRRTGAGGAGEVPLIRADTRPMMVRPAEPGGLKIPDRNMLIYDPGKRMVEHLLPLPEQPMARPTPGAARAAAASPPSLPPAAASASPLPATAPEPAGQAVAALPPAIVTQGTPPAKSGSVRLQLGSVRNAAAARREWDRIKEKNVDLLGAFSASPVRADLGDKGVYYRILTGPVGEPAAARICGALKQRKVGCIVVR